MTILDIVILKYALTQPSYPTRLLDLDPRFLDHLAPLGRVRLDHGGELFRVAADRDEAHRPVRLGVNDISPPYKISVGVRSGSQWYMPAER